MAEGPDYAILGRGQWAVKMRSILEAEQRRVTCIANARRDATESADSYQERLASALRASGAQIAWLCVAPGAHVFAMVKAAIDAGVHSVAEKPWLVPARETEALAALAHRQKIAIGVHFEYCLLDEIEVWRQRFQRGHGLRFGGRFATSCADRLGIRAAVNLGCHLVAMRRYAVPEAEIGELACAYESSDDRRVWLEADCRMVDSVDFTQNQQPIIQRFIERFEAATEGAEFPFRLDFARAVADDMATCPALQTAASRRL